MALASGIAGCMGGQVREEPARLQVIAEPEVARIYVDDRFLASARVLAVRPKALSRGVHYVTIEAPGYFPHDVRVDLPPGTTTVRIKLRPIPP